MTTIVPVVLAAVAVRNPFWPIGHEGVKEEISAEPKVEVRATVDSDDTATAGAAAQAAEQAAIAAKSVSALTWAEARKTLKVSGTTTVTGPDGRKRHSVIINGRTYGDGDLISINHEDHRFTWRVQGLTEGATLRLVRMLDKEIEEPEEESKGDK